MKTKKGFKREEVLIISVHEQDQEFQDLFYKEEDRQHGYNRFWTEFEPYGKKDFSNTLTMKHIEKYWQDQSNNNHYKGSLKDFIKDYDLGLEIWFIESGYDFTGIKTIIIDY